MGTPPPPDAPDVPSQQALAAAASFPVTPPVALLCGLGIPGFNLPIKIPSIPFPPKLPWPFSLNLSLSLSCDLNNPLDAHLSFGGGRVAQPPLDPDTIEK